MILYAALALVLLPWATEPGMANPRITAVAGAAVLIANLCTAVLLGSWYWSTGRPAVLILACGYLWGGVMAGLHMTTFPGALFPEPLFGGEHTVGWLYVAWRGGAAGSYLAAVLVEASSVKPSVPPVRGRRLAVGLTLTLLACALGAVMADRLAIASIVAGTRWSVANASLVWLWVVVCAVTLWVIWTKRAFDDVLYLWLAMVVVAAMVDLSLGNVTGRRYTLAWHASRASLVVSSYLLLGFLVGDLTQRRHPTPILRLGAYGGAIAAILGAVFLRWFLDPWLGATVPYITLYGAVAIAVWLGGWGPAVLATALGYGIVHTLYVAPGRLAVGGPPEILQLVLFVVSCALIIGLGEGLRRTRDRHRVAEAQAQERAAALQRADAGCRTSFEIRWLRCGPDWRLSG